MRSLSMYEQSYSHVRLGSVRTRTANPAFEGRAEECLQLVACHRGAPLNLVVRCRPRRRS